MRSHLLLHNLLSHLSRVSFRTRYSHTQHTQTQHTSVSRQMRLCSISSLAAVDSFDIYGRQHSKNPFKAFIKSLLLDLKWILFPTLAVWNPLNWAEYYFSFIFLISLCTQLLHIPHSPQMHTYHHSLFHTALYIHHTYTYKHILLPVFRPFTQHCGRIYEVSICSFCYSWHTIEHFEHKILALSLSYTHTHSHTRKHIHLTDISSDIL